MLTRSSEGFNFLLVVPMIPLVVLGLPWSILSIFLAANDVVAGNAAFWAEYTTPALLNVALHALRWRRFQARTKRRTTVERIKD